MAFAIPPERFGDWRISVPVRASAAQRAFERCPREDPGHTVACPFGWEGTRDARAAHAGDRHAARARRERDRRRALRDACAPVRAGAGAATKTFRVAAGAARRLTLRAPRARAASTVTIGETRRTFIVNRSARAATGADEASDPPRLLLVRPPASAHAASGSLTYVKDGDVYVSAPDGSRATRITTDGGYAWPSQADDGTLVAVRQTAENGRTPRRLHRFRRDGVRIGAPLETVKVDNRNFVGPLAPQVSPDGTMIAYHFFNTGVLSDRARTSGRLHARRPGHRARRLRRRARRLPHALVDRRRPRARLLRRPAHLARRHRHPRRRLRRLVRRPRGGDAADRR